MTVAELLAREAIRATHAAYNAFGDRGRLEEMVSTFTADGVLVLSDGSELRGHAAIRQRLGQVGPAAADAHERSRPMRHHLSTSHVEFEGASIANAWTYFQVLSAVGLDHAGRYVDRLVAAGDGRWLLASRRVVVEWAAADSVVGAKVRT